MEKHTEGIQVPSQRQRCYETGEEEVQSRQFEVNEWIIVNRQLASIVRFGYGQYEGQARVLRPDERMGDWTAGCWQPLSMISRLSFPARFTVRSTFLSVNEPPIQIQQGASGYLRKFDMEDDLIVTIDGRAGRHFIFLSDATRLDMEAG